MSKSQAKRGRPKGGQGEAAPRVGHLDSLGAILREMSAVYREARLGKTKLDEATKLVYCLKEMRAVVEAMTYDELLERLKSMETHLENGEQLNGKRHYHQIEARPIGSSD